MQITPIGYILIPLGILFFIINTDMLFYLFLFFVPFSASAVINIKLTTFGLQIPYYIGTEGFMFSTITGLFAQFIADSDIIALIMWVIIGLSLSFINIVQTKICYENRKGSY